MKSPNHKFETDWTSEVQRLGKELKSIRLPVAIYDLSAGVTILDVQKFVNNHLQTIKMNNGNPVYLPYLERLRALHTRLING